MKIKTIIILFFVLAAYHCFAQVFPKQGAGVTIIVHGWNPNGNQPAWMNSMANSIVARSGGSGQIGTITVTGTSGNLTATCSNWNFNMASANSGEIVILVNWTAVSNHLTTGVTAQSVAAVVAPKIYQGQNGQPALSELPIHLIGHSRGGGMVFEIARLLGLQGIEVEQVTALDPHPLTSSDPQGVAPPIGPGQTIDTPIQIYENILFADNYWQNINYPKGQNLTGAYNRLWTSLPGGYHNETGYTYNILGTNYDFSDHLNILLAYQGSINLTTPVTNGEATMNTNERAWFNTYENSGQNIGFVYSRNIAGNRKSNDTPNSADAVVAGYNNDANLGGSGARQTLTWTNAVWPNIISVTGAMNMVPLIVGNSYSMGGSDQVVLSMPMRTYANNVTVSIYLDNDRNPFNGSFLQTSSTYSNTGNTINVIGENFQPTDLMDNYYYILVGITDGTHNRYIYAPYKFYRYCNVYFNDANLEAALLAIPGIDANTNGYIECSEAISYTGAINVNNKNISDMAGIEAFINISSLDCGNNLFTSLDLSSDTALHTLYCSNGSLSSLNITGLDSLTTLQCNGNQLSDLDLSSFAALNNLNCSNNSLTSLNVKNGNNTNFSFFSATNNPDLHCIQVDNSGWSTTHWTNIDAGEIFSTDCATVSLPELSESLLSIFPNPATNEITVSNIVVPSVLSVCDINGKILINKIIKYSNEKIDLSGIAKGVYIIKMKDDNAIITSKLIKQ